MVESEAWLAKKRSASSTEDFPVLFLPVMSVMRPSPDIERSLIPRNPLIEMSEMCRELSYRPPFILTTALYFGPSFRKTPSEQARSASPAKFGH